MDERLRILARLAEGRRQCGGARKFAAFAANMVHELGLKMLEELDR